MHRKSLQLVLLIVFVLASAAACGGSSGAKKVTTTRAAPAPSAAPSALSFKAAFSAPSHHPVVNKNWPIMVTVTDLSGKPVAATLQMNVLLGSLQVGQIDNGKIYHFVGRHHEIITWPQASAGHKLTLQSVVKVKGKTKKLSWAVSVVKK